MEYLVIFDPKTKTVYKTYREDSLYPEDRNIICPNETDWNPFRAFSTSLEDFITNEDADFYYGTDIRSVSREFADIIGGVKSYNSDHPNTIFDASCLVISTTSELKTLYQKELLKSEYLLEENEDKARKIYLKQTNDYSADQAFRDGIKWARKHN